MVSSSRETVIDALEGRNEGPIPIIPPFQGTWALNVMDIAPEKAISDPGLNAKVQSEIAELCGFDAIEGMWDWLSMVEAMGSDVEFRKGMGAVTVSHSLSEDPDASIEVNPRDDARAVANLNTIRALLEGDRFIYASVPGTFTLSAELRGVEQLMMDSLLENDVYRSILRRTADTLKDYCKFYDDVADGVMLCESTGSPALMDPVYLRNDVIPLNTELFDIVEGYRMYHHCGDIIELLPEFPPASTNMLSIHGEVPMTDALEYFDCCLTGGVSSVESLLKDNTDNVFREISNIIVEIEGNKNRFMLSATCDISPSTPLENVSVWRDILRGNDIIRQN